MRFWQPKQMCSESRPWVMVCFLVGLIRGGGLRRGRRWPAGGCRAGVGFRVGGGGWCGNGGLLRGRGGRRAGGGGGAAGRRGWCRRSQSFRFLSCYLPVLWLVAC